VGLAPPAWWSGGIRPAECSLLWFLQQTRASSCSGVRLSWSRNCFRQNSATKPGVRSFPGSFFPVQFMNPCIRLTTRMIRGVGGSWSARSLVSATTLGDLRKRRIGSCSSWLRLCVAMTGRLGGLVPGPTPSGSYETPRMGRSAEPSLRRPSSPSLPQPIALASTSHHNPLVLPDAAPPERWNTAGRMETSLSSRARESHG
jgi:hypothetical protein